MFGQIIANISTLTIGDLKDVESHLNSFSKSLEELSHDYKRVASFLDKNGFSSNNIINAVFHDIGSEMKLIREQFVTQRNSKKAEKKDDFSRMEAKIVSVDDINPLIMQKLPSNLELLTKAEKNLDLLIQLLSMYHNFYLIVATELLDKEELKAMVQRDLLRNDLYVLHIAIISHREQLQKQSQIDQLFQDIQKKRKSDYDFVQLQDKYAYKLRKEAYDEALIKKIKIKIDIALENIARKGDELEFRAAKCEKKGKLELAARLRLDASIASDLAQNLRLESVKLKKIPQENAARISKLEQFGINCRQLLDEATQSTLATRHYKWWKVVLANIAFCLTGIGLLVSSLRWVTTGNFLFFNKKDSAKKIDNVKELVTVMSNVATPRKSLL